MALIARLTAACRMRFFVLSAFSLFLALPLHAARPMITDDARIVDAQACQLESWGRKKAHGTEFWALPACNLTGNLELTLGGAISRDAGVNYTSDVVVQGKTLFKTLAPNGWSLGLAVGTVRHPHLASRDWYFYLPFSLSWQEDDVVIHTNLGALREGQTRRERLTWGVGGEVKFAEKSWLVAEAFGQNQGQPFYQLGVRHWLIAERVQLDATYGDRFDRPGGERWFSIGLRLISPPWF